MRLRKEYAWTALALVASVGQVACSSKDNEAAAPITTASMHEPTADQPAANPDAVETKRALATLSVASASSVSGDLHFEQRSDGLWVEGNVTGLSPGAHGIQVHEKGDCTADDASSAGDPFPSATEPAATTAQTSSGEQPGAMSEQNGATAPSATTAQNSPTTRPDAATAQTSPASEPMAATSQAPVGTQPGATTQAPSGAGVLGNIEADASGDAKVAILAKNVSLDEANPILDRSVLIYADQIAAQASTDAGDPVACGVIRSTAAAPSQNPVQDNADFSMRGDEKPTGTGGAGSEE